MVDSRTVYAGVPLRPGRERRPLPASSIAAPRCPDNPANYIVVDNGNGWQTIYYHLMTDSIAVKVGQTVVAGQPLGLVGSSGSSTDPHLHFEVHQQRRYRGDELVFQSSYWASPFT